MNEGGPLACPSCAKRHSLDERFCRECGMPLVYVGRADEEPVTDARGRARKVRPEYARGEPVRAVTARNQAEAEMIQGLLLEEGIPSMLKRTRGFDVADFLAAGPRDVLVPQSAAEDARELLAGFEPTAPPSRAAAPTPPGRLLAVLLGSVAAAAAIVYALYQAAS